MNEHNFNKMKVLLLQQDDENIIKKAHVRTIEIKDSFYGCVFYNSTLSLIGVCYNCEQVKNPESGKNIKICKIAYFAPSLIQNIFS